MTEKVTLSFARRVVAPAVDAEPLPIVTFVVPPLTLFVPRLMICVPLFNVVLPI